MFTDVVEVLPVGELVDDAPSGTAETDVPVVEFEKASVHQAQKGRFEGGEPFRLLTLFGEIVLDQVQGFPTMAFIAGRSLTISSRSSCRRLLFTPPGMLCQGCTFLPPRVLMIS